VTLGPMKPRIDLGGGSVGKRVNMVFSLHLTLRMKNATMYSFPLLKSTYACRHLDAQHVSTVKP